MAFNQNLHREWLCGSPFFLFVQSYALVLALKGSHANTKNAAPLLPLLSPPRQWLSRTVPQANPVRFFLTHFPTLSPHPLLNNCVLMFGVPAFLFLYSARGGCIPFTTCTQMLRVGRLFPPCDCQVLLKSIASGDFVQGMRQK